jgi:SAM-dependent methyltransferase
MNLHERDRFLERLQADKGKIALGSSEVRSIDQILAAVWGIAFPGTIATWEELLPRSAGSLPIARYNKAHDEVAKAMARRKKRAMAAARARLYDALADPIILGPVTSQRRHLIVDGICMAIGLARAISTGAIVDIGCHAGFVSTTLADYLNCKVVGIDPSDEAITLARSRTAGKPQIEFYRAAMPWKVDSRFDLAIAFDSMPEGSGAKAAFLRSLGDLLIPGGVAIVSSMYWVHEDIEVTRRQMRMADLGFGYADVLGGYGGIPVQFDAEIVLVLLKGGGRRLPRNFCQLAENDWPQFRDYANAPSTMPSEKTQAFERSLRVLASLKRRDKPADRIRRV